MRRIQTYDEPQWRRLREQALKRDKYIDQLDKRYGKYRNAEIVHHIFPVEWFPEYQFCLWNLISITRANHNRLHERNGQKLTKAGVDLLIRTAEKNGVEVPQNALQSILAEQPPHHSRYRR